MTTILNPDGWSGATSGRWNRRANRVIDERRGVRTTTDDRRLINALGGDDVIIGRRNDDRAGVINERAADLQLGRGDDLLIGSSRNGIGIDNQGFIFMGPGNDRIEASGGELAMRNRRFIFMQDGNDVVDVRDGGIRGRGFIDMGQGRDTFIGFGNHTIFGSENDRDTLQLPRGRYEVRRRGGGRRGREVRVERGDDQLRLFDFNEVGAIDSRRRDRIDINQNGTLAVRRDGTVEFI